MERDMGIHAHNGAIIDRGNGFKQFILCLSPMCPGPETGDDGAEYQYYPSVKYLEEAGWHYENKDGFIGWLCPLCVTRRKQR